MIFGLKWEQRLFVFVRLAEGVPFSTLVNQFSQLPVSVAFSKNCITTAGFYSLIKSLFTCSLFLRKSLPHFRRIVSVSKKKHIQITNYKHIHMQPHTFIVPINLSTKFEAYKFTNFSSLYTPGISFKYFRQTFITIKM